MGTSQDHRSSRKKLQIYSYCWNKWKGSTAHMLASVFQEAGYKTGLYTSPHLIDFRERIKVNGKMIPKDAVVDFYSAYADSWKDIEPSFFEMTVLMAFDHFRSEQVDIAIIETGLGGRLDSTNIVSPEVSVITNIGLDHTQFLGTTIPQIALEKAGIIKPHSLLYLAKWFQMLKKLLNLKPSSNTLTCMTVLTFPLLQIRFKG